MVAALGLISYRFWHIELAPFARDEPQFLRAAGQQLRSGHWLSANPLYGNLGLRYGPAAFWFYGVVQAVAGEDPRVAIVAMGLTLTLAHLGLVFAVWRLFGESAALLAVLIAWVASSPYEFQWSRLAWDLTSNAAVFAAAALLCTYRDLGVGRALALGTVIGLGLATHPMLVPFALAVLAVVAAELWRAGGVRSRPRPRSSAHDPGERALSALPDARACRPPRAQPAGSHGMVSGGCCSRRRASGRRGDSRTTSRAAGLPSASGWARRAVSWSRRPKPWSSCASR